MNCATHRPKARGVVLHGDRYSPELQEVGTLDAQMFRSSPTGSSESLHSMYLMAITEAQHSIVLGNSYFVPDRLTRRTLIAAAEREVQVTILVPGRRIDTEAVRLASRALWGHLLESGVRIFEFQPAMYHCIAASVRAVGAR